MSPLSLLKLPIDWEGGRGEGGEEGEGVPAKVLFGFFFYL